VGDLHSRYLGGNLVFYDTHRMRLVDALGGDTVKFIDDFTERGTATADNLVGWTTTLVEAGAGESTVAYTDASGGAILITTDANENDGVNLQRLGEAFGFSSSQQATYFGIRFQASEATQSDFLVGLCITDTDLLGGRTDGVYFEKLDGGTGISFVTEKDSTETQTNNLATFAAATYVILEFYFDGTTVFAFIDGVQVATHTTNIPNDELLTPSIHFLSGAAGAKTMTVDWVRAIQVGR
jgi:hypothetical protein